MDKESLDSGRLMGEVRGMGSGRPRGRGASMSSGGGTSMSQMRHSCPMGPGWGTSLGERPWTRVCVWKCWFYLCLCGLWRVIHRAWMGLLARELLVLGTIGVRVSVEVW